MKKTKYDYMNIGFSVLIATLILTTSYVLKLAGASEYANTVTHILIALWFVPYFYFNNKSKRYKSVSCKS